MEDKKIITKEDIAEQLVTKARTKKGDAVQAVEAVFAEIANVQNVKASILLLRKRRLQFPLPKQSSSNHPRP